MQGSFRTDSLREDAHTFIIPLPDEVSILLGQIVIYWGAFEHRMDVLTEHILSGMNWDQPEGWKRFPFKKRVNLFRDTLKAYTAHFFPHESEAFNKIADEALRIYWQRNVVAHGFYGIEPDGIVGDDGLQGVKYTAFGTVNGQQKSIQADTETLAQIWHDISHLTGSLLAALNRMGATVSSVDLVIPDSDLLSDRDTGNFRFLAMSSRF